MPSRRDIISNRCTNRALTGQQCLAHESAYFHPGAVVKTMVDAAVDARFRELDRHSFIPPGSNTQRLEEYYRFAEQLCLQARAYASSDAIST
jgi:hypothetical protein